jgi:hypothetical protein
MASPLKRRSRGKNKKMGRSRPSLPQTERAVQNRHARCRRGMTAQEASVTHS